MLYATNQVVFSDCIINVPGIYMWPDLSEGVLYVHSFKTLALNPLVTSIDQQHMCVILLKAKQSAFTQASFSSPPNFHKCLGGL